VKLRIDCRLGRWYVLVAQECEGTMQARVFACARLMLPEAFGDKNNPKWDAARAAVESTYPENESLFSGAQKEKSTLVEAKLCFGEERGRQQQFCRELQLGSIVTREDGLYYQVRIRDSVELIPLLRAYSPWLQILPGEHDLCGLMEEALQQMEANLDGTFGLPHPTHYQSLEKMSSGGTAEEETIKGEDPNQAKDGNASKEWKLLSPFQSRLLQFCLDLLADPKQDGSYTERVKMLAKRYGFSEEDRTLALLNDADFFKAPDRPRLPMSTIEREYLQYILSPRNVPEVTLFLSESTRRAVTSIMENWEKQNKPGEKSPARQQTAGTLRWLKHIQWKKAAGMELPRNPGPAGFRKLICAIRERRLISYRYRVRTQHEYQEATCLPWKLEYSAFDRRWWIILYDTKEERTIKTPLNHLRDVQLLEQSTVTDSAILTAMENLRMKEPVILHIRDSHNALQRCFIIFENQEITGSDYSPETGYVLKMHAYRFDREEILRQLMYLGPNVRLAEPADLREELQQRLKQAQKNMNNSSFL
jgi:predicted DNA-binding transcriptional regulator YafY